jgi:hypothetical protein
LLYIPLNLCTAKGLLFTSVNLLVRVRTTINPTLHVALAAVKSQSPEAAAAAAAAPNVRQPFQMFRY